MTAEQPVYQIDAKGLRIGRLATQIAVLLRGKNRPDFAPESNFAATVMVSNVKKLEVDPKTAAAKMYYRHSTYPGGLKSESLEQLLKDRPEEAVRRAVWNMLPKNKHRKLWIHGLKFHSS
ncbi:MAG: 50S ribosomal protein L13 [Candidatus Kerfeldbacteria bacterium]|nr:50S ribosomal protein L13 [Candidatus Kerfeldbacteria bacterium]